MTLLNCFKKFMCAATLFVLATALPANALTQNEFNTLVSEKGFRQAVDQSYDEKTPLQDIARMALDPDVSDFQSGILEGVVTKALAEGMSLGAIIEMFQGVEGLNPTVFLAAMVRSGIPEEDVRTASLAAGISEIVVAAAFDKAKNDATQAYTPAGGGGTAAPLAIGAAPTTGGGAAGLFASPSTLP